MSQKINVGVPEETTSLRKMTASGKMEGGMQAVTLIRGGECGWEGRQVKDAKGTKSGREDSPDRRSGSGERRKRRSYAGASDGQPGLRTLS